MVFYRPARRPVRLAQALLILAAVPACASWHPTTLSEAVSPQALELYEQGLSLRAEGQSLRAAHKFEAAVALAPTLVEAHRQLQDMAVSSLSRGQMVERYERYVRDSPGDASRWYLLGRLWSDPCRQLRAFERAVELDPALSWGHLGLGFGLAAIEDVAGSVEHFHEALALRPGSRSALLGLLGVLVAHERHEEAARIADILRVQYGDDPVAFRAVMRAHLEAGRVRRALEAALEGLSLPVLDGTSLRAFGDVVLGRGIASDWVRAFGLLSVGQDSRRPDVRRLLGLLAVRQGEFGLAYRHLVTLSDPIPDPSVRQELRFLRVVRGEYLVALEEAHRDVPGFLAYDRLQDRHERAVRAARYVEERTTAGRLFELAGALVSLGWTREALHLLRRVEPDTAVAEGVRALVDEVRAHEAFVASLKAYFLEVYRLAGAGEATPDLDEALDQIRRLSAWHLGRNVVDPVVRTSFGPLGSFVDPRPSSGCGLARYFDRFNRFFVVGKRAGGPPEAVLFDRLAAGELPGPWSSGVELALTENQTIEAYLQHRGGSIAAAALLHFVYLDLDAARREAAQGYRHWEQLGARLAE
ncbi:MAG: hypothetical protein AB1486_09470, partial [Planctomycetota bacterium]